MRAICTVIGTDRVGIIAKVSNVLSGADCNILDISQTVLQEFFAMVMLVDLENINVSFEKLKEMLNDAGHELGMEIKIQREEIFNSMHRI